MDSSNLRRFRIWVLILASMNELLTSAFYIYVIVMFSIADINWMGWLIVVVSTAILILSIYNVKGRLNLGKYKRALLMLFFAAFLLGLHFYYINSSIKFMNEYDGYNPFECDSRDKLCYLSWAQTYTAIILGFNMIPEVIWTWRVGSSDPQTAPYGGYADQIIISPDQQHTIAQYPHAQGKIDAPGEAPIAQGSQPYMYQQPQQQYYTQPAMSQPYYNPHQGVSQPASQPPQFNVPYQQPVGQQPYIPQPFVPPQNN